MSNVQLYLAIGLPTVLVLVGLVLNWTATNAVAARLGVIESDMRQFYRSIGKLEGRLEEMKSDS